MDKEELYELLKKNLSIQVHLGWMGSQKVLNVKIRFDQKEIASGEVTLEYDDDF